MNRQRLMLFAVILMMILFGAACGEAPNGEVEVEDSPGSSSTGGEIRLTEEVSEKVDSSSQAEEATNSEPTEEMAEIASSDEPELPAETEPAAESLELAETNAIEEGGVVAPGSGEIIADTGFRPEVNGFSFANYGDDVNLVDEPAGPIDWQTEYIVQDLFGEDVVCARIEDDACVPTPAARLWVDVVDRAKAGGHCEGFAALSAELFTGFISPDEFGVSTASELELSYDTLDAISLEWMVQAIEPIVSETAEFRQMTPTEILDFLIATMIDGNDFYTMGLYGPNGGHSVTPYKIEDLGSGIFLVYVYDSNYPGAEKFVEINTNDATWRYAGGALDPANDPAPWTGGQGSMDLTSTETRFAEFECPFCARSGDSLANKILVLLNGKGGRVSATNGKNKRVAMGAGNSEVNEIPGAQVVRMKGNPLYNDDRNWLMILPVDDYKINVTGETNQTVEPTQVAIFQPGRSYVVDDINLDPGQEDEFFISDEGQFSYTAGDDETPTLEFGTDEIDDVDGMFIISGAELSAGHSFTLMLDDETDKFTFFEDDPDLETFDLTGYTVDDEGLESQFFFDDVLTGDEDWAIFELEDDGDFMSLGLDEDLDGEVDLPDADGDGILDTYEPDTDGDGIIDDYDDEGLDEESLDADVEDGVAGDETPDDGSLDEEGAEGDEGSDVGDDVSGDEEPEDDGSIEDQGGDEGDDGGDDGGDEDF